MLGEGPLASIDNLTMLYTRRHLHEVANAEARRAEMQGRPFGVILLELAGVAEVNKLRGYAAGDEKIRITARTLQTIAARRQAVACRYSRCRLALLVPDSDEASTELLATETAEELGDGARTTFSAWHRDDTDDAVVARARAALD